MLETNYVLVEYVSQHATVTPVVPNFNIAKTIFVFKNCDVLQTIIVKIHKFAERIRSDR